MSPLHKACRQATIPQKYGCMPLINQNSGDSTEKVGGMNALLQVHSQDFKNWERPSVSPRAWWLHFWTPVRIHDGALCVKRTMKAYISLLSVGPQSTDAIGTPFLI